MTIESPFDYQHIAVREFMEAGNQTCPTNPFIPSVEIRLLRAKLIMEEAVETANALGFRVQLIHESLEFTDCYDPDLEEIADGCADLKVVTVGTEIACGINGMPIFKEVMRSNMTKDFSGAKRPDGKILKGATYEPPNIEQFLK
jgi:predicted HAD superfamily Cof-like phosphohydrolase